ncbi:MAG: hypothetical protein IPH26_22930 [Sterolibacteriaceae bacterium]|uniref:Uncharacterized protein n=1 Tax=Candidatus Methylophosphatis roskildensis TaxID=2899263 RepID=A0A9D7HTG0_9PROT|nr:hypothetical protein [Candidatus Methylophosphatis roskildensis]
MRLRAGNYESTLQVASSSAGGTRRLRAMARDVGVERQRCSCRARAQIDAQLGDRPVERGRSAYGDALHEAGVTVARLVRLWLRESAQAQHRQKQVRVARAARSGEGARAATSVARLTSRWLPRSTRSGRRSQRVPQRRVSRRRPNPNTAHSGID